jgi:hypothetical protein
MRFDKFALRLGIVEFPDIVRIALDRWLMRFAMGLLNSARKSALGFNPLRIGKPPPRKTRSIGHVPAPLTP